jgi:two-component system cell cycle response regulator CtrA
MRPQSWKDERIRQLETILQERNEVIRELRQAITSTTEWMPPPGFTANEGRILQALMGHKVASRSILFATLYPNDYPNQRIFDVFVCKLRKKLAPLGVHIQTVPRVGYRMDEESKEKLRALGA